MLLIQSNRDHYQYDIFQRYDLLRHVLSAAFASRAGGEPVRVLDVGSGPNSLSEEFLPPWFHVTRSDVCSFDDPAIVLLTPRKPLPFPDNAFDVVLAIDVLEHLPADEREPLVQECVRVASQLAVLGFPRRSPHVERAEATLNEAFRVAFGKENNFLNEHSMMGLPEPSTVRATLERLHVDYVEASTSPLSRWLLCSVLDVFYCAQFGISEEKGDFNWHMNSFCGDLGQGDEHYRACFFALKNPDLDKTIGQALTAPATGCADQTEQEWQFLAAQELLKFFGKYRDSWSGRYQQLAQVKDQCITGLQQELDRAAASLEQKKKEFSEAIAQIAEKTALVTERAAQVATLIAQMADQRKQIIAQEQALLDVRLRNSTLDEINAEQTCLIRELKEHVQDLQAERAQLQRTLDVRVRQIDRITTSFSWRYTRPARIFRRWIYWIRRLPRKMHSIT